MIDFTKLLCDNQHIIQDLYTYCTNTLHAHKPQNNNYTCFSNGSPLFRLEFRKVRSNGNVIGYRHVEVCFSPHYINNNYLHNGNDFTPNDCITTLGNVFESLHLTHEQLEQFRVVGIEFGVNIQLNGNIEEIIAGFKSFKTKAFSTPQATLPLYKISQTTDYKAFKAYAKGLQFSKYPEYGINRNTLRLEVKSKQAKNISKYGISTAKDLLKIATYGTLSEELLKEFDYVFVVNLSPDLTELAAKELEFINSMNTFDFKKETGRVKFSRMKDKYNRLLCLRNNRHLEIKGLIIDKLFSFQPVTFSTHEGQAKDDNVKLDNCAEDKRGKCNT